jgi:hypothetical protein
MIRGLVLVAMLATGALAVAADDLPDSTKVTADRGAPAGLAGALQQASRSAADSAGVAADSTGVAADTGFFAADGGFDLPDGLSLAGADTIRTNLWLAEALMAETVHAAMRHLPPAPATVVLVPFDREQRTNILTTMVTEQLSDAGYAVHLDAAPADSVGGNYEFRYQVVELGLAYPATGRKLGLWRDWVAREMAFSALYTIVETPGGRVLFSDRVRRSYQDRVPSDDLAGCQNPAYTFTSAAVAESGWQRRLEEIVVLGALAGLVAIYFQNTD